MKSYVNKIVLLWSCCIIGFAFAVEPANVGDAPAVKQTTTKEVIEAKKQKVAVESQPIIQEKSYADIKREHRLNPDNHNWELLETFELTPNTSNGSRADHVITVSGTVDNYAGEGAFGLFELYYGSLWA